VHALCRSDDRAQEAATRNGAGPEESELAGAGEGDSVVDGADLYGDRILL
jgi:hypothetical protein